ncbi:hypothetical protein GLOIN_2v1784007 [Rhizophagus irregularis DAOM 181602=DAOM 197198]|nr:hypothetical protein GLOIN_2v1784007 [Rhizophagus irregularis DAOM 181602=DAOM 197198]
MYLRSTNDDLALKFFQGYRFLIYYLSLAYFDPNIYDQDAVMLAYLLEYYSRSYMECSWMINVTKILPEDEELFNIYIVPNFTTYAEKIEGKIEGKFGTILCWLRKILLLPGYKNLDYKGHKSFLYIESEDIIFDNPFIEAVMTLRWRKAKIYWMIPLIFYIIYIFLFSFLSQLYLSDNDDNKNKHNSTFMIVVGIFYYVGIYLLIVEFMQMRNYKLNTSFNEINEINNQGIVILLTVTTLILWIEMLLWLRLFTEVAVYIYIFGNILKKIIPFFVFMIILTIGFGHSMFVLFGHPSLLDLNPSASTYTLDNGTTNLKLTGEIPVNPFDTIWDAILSAYY